MSSIFDINLAPSGREKIEWVKSFMPVLDTIGNDFRENKPFKGLKIAMSIHLEAKLHILPKYSETAAPRFI